MLKNILLTVGIKLWIVIMLDRIIVKCSYRPMPNNNNNIILDL